MMLLEQRGHILAKVQATVTWLGGTIFMFPWSPDWTSFFLHVKLFLPSIFNFVDLWSSMSCIVLDIVLADLKVIKELWVFIDGKVQGYKFKPTMQAFWCTWNLQGTAWNSGRLNYSELANILRRAVKGEYFAKGREKCMLLGKLLDKEVENLEDLACPKSSISRWWRNVDLLEKPSQTQEHASLWRAQSKIVW